MLTIRRINHSLGVWELASRVKRIAGSPLLVFTVHYKSSWFTLRIQSNAVVNKLLPGD
jgi:hypothetical protein